MKNLMHEIARQHFANEPKVETMTLREYLERPRAWPLKTMTYEEISERYPRS